MTRFRLSDRARRDLAEIYAFTFERWGRAQADAYTNKLIDCCAGLGRFNALLRRVPGRPGRYLRRIGAHLLVVKPVGDEFHVLAVLHQSMDLGSRLDELSDEV